MFVLLFFLVPSVASRMICFIRLYDQGIRPRESHFVVGFGKRNYSKQEESGLC